MTNSNTPERTEPELPWKSAAVLVDLESGITAFTGPGDIFGIQLTPECNAEIKPALRNSDGSYVGEAEVAVVQWHFPHLFSVDETETENFIRDEFPEVFAAN
ncbi:MAG TPA: hypothetical protein VFU07_05145 [Candidatus Lumbricidophila sp.]|nr:hypothetical protein [Candidatus Lumbricidophila sp.]